MSKTKEFLENLCKILGHPSDYEWTHGEDCFHIKCSRCGIIIYKYEYALPKYVKAVPERSDIPTYSSDGTSYVSHTPYTITWDSTSSSVHQNYYSFYYSI